ncbi:MAG: F0F1 ATP synthase subunit A [Candidatus Sericytochromatia bacterium]|nr:F0F1 ATP synthase subunit A [Candidatus Sericytochromatia bacterium]
MNTSLIAQAHDEHHHSPHGHEPVLGMGTADPVHVSAQATSHGGGHGGGELIASHWQETIPGWGVFHVDTVLYGGIVMLALLLVFGTLGRAVSAIPDEQSGYVGTVLEEVVGFCQGLIRDYISPSVTPYLWFLGSVFLFILTSNWLALLPWKAWEMLAGEKLAHAMGLPHALAYHAPTADLNTTLALALISLVMYWYFGIASNGLTGFLSHHWFDKPIGLFPLRMLEDVTRPMSLALRLFANMTAGHVLGLVLLALTYFVIPVIVLPLELFVGAIQAFVFTVLSAAYIGTAAAQHSHEH